MKIVKRIVLSVSILLLLLATAVFITIRFYEDDVARYAMKRVKKEMTTGFEVENVSLVFWRTFPSTSLHLENVYIQESLPEGDTLLFAQSLFLKLNFWDLIGGNYKVNEVEVEKAQLNLRVNDDKLDNWHFWKEGTSDSSSFEIRLEEVLLNDTRVKYDDASTRFHLDLFSVSSSGSGDFSARRFGIELDADVFVSSIKSGEDVFLQDQTVAGEILLQADVDRGNYVFEPAEIACGNLDLTIQGTVDVSESGSIALYAETTDENIEDALGVLPLSIRNTLRSYNPEGDFSAKAMVSQQSAKAPVMIEAEVIAGDGSLRLKDEGVALRDIETALYFVRGGKKDRIQLKRFSCGLDKSRLTAQGSIQGFDDPILDLSVSAEMQLNDVRDFMDLQQLEVCDGLLKAEAGVQGRLRYVPADTAFNWREVIASGSAELSQGQIKIKDSNRYFQGLTAAVSFDKQHALINRFEGTVNGSDFSLQGTLLNLVPFLFEPNARVLLDANLQSRLVDFTQMVEEDRSTANESEYEFGLPKRLDFRLNTSIDKFIFRKFEAGGVKGMVVYQDDVLTIDPLSFETADGKLNAQLVLAPLGEGSYRMNCLADVTAINIKKVFTEFENFGQDYIQDRHLNGQANAKVQFRAVVTKALEIPSEKVESLIDVTIDNGELVGFESLQEIAEYLRSNKWVAPFVDEDRFAERMKKVSFSRLENVIEIRNRKVIIPLMAIRSSAMDITAKGTHTFDHVIDYAIGFNMRDLLIRRERDIQEVDDGLGKSMYIAMRGTVDNPEFAVDKELAKEVRQEALQQEKQNVKGLLKEEFGLFKNDASVGGYKESSDQQPGSTITIEWEGDQQTEQQDAAPAQKPTDKRIEDKKPQPQPTDPKKKKTPKWLEEKER